MSDTISEPAILIPTVSLHFLPMPLLKRAAPFDDPDWIYELKMDGFRALAVIENGRAQLLSRNGNPFASFYAMAIRSLPSLRWQNQSPIRCRTSEPSLMAKFAP